MAIFVKADFRGDWSDGIHSVMPDLEVRHWPDAGPLENLDYALVWKPEPGFLASLPNLKLIYSIGAGIDHLNADPHLPKSIPTVRMVDPGLTKGMVAYVTWACLHLHRNMFQVQKQQAQKIWDDAAVARFPSQVGRVGILGLGQLGQACAKALIDLGFHVSGWSQSPKSLPSVTSYQGASGLETMLAQTDYLVCLLPLTPETKGILNFDSLSKLRPGGGLVAVGRGKQLVPQDLIRLLDVGHLSGTILDVTDPEPLPQNDPLWSHERVLITPHVASVTDPFSAGATVGDSIKKFESGEPMPHVLDWEKGY